MAALHASVRHEIHLYVVKAPPHKALQLPRRVLLPERMGHIVGNGSVHPGKRVSTGILQKNFLKAVAGNAGNLLFVILSEESKGRIINSGPLSVFVQLADQPDQLFLRDYIPARIQIHVGAFLILVAERLQFLPQKSARLLISVRI